MRCLRKWRCTRPRRKLAEARRDLALLRVERSVLIAERDLLAGVAARDALRVRLETQTLAQGVAAAEGGSSP